MRNLLTPTAVPFYSVFLSQALLVRPHSQLSLSALSIFARWWKDAAALFILSIKLLWTLPPLLLLSSLTYNWCTIKYIDRRERKVCCLSGFCSIASTLEHFFPWTPQCDGGEKGSLPRPWETCLGTRVAMAL
ncbi:hypothetical protein F4810DRAFT_262895 [Camillea tinctor]|nr:hypothetical protein F4810DRAFT_262895 [Camillea tinctor]